LHSIHGRADSKKLHATVAQRVEQSGRFWMSTTELKGKTWFRFNPVNFRTREQHMQELFSLLEQECREWARERVTLSHASD
jgi:hypothetical protein